MRFVSSLALALVVLAPGLARAQPSTGTVFISGGAFAAIEQSPTSSGFGGSDQLCPPLHSRPARSPEAVNAVVPLRNAEARAARTGARSAAVNSRSQPHPIEKLHTAPGNC